jgi:hypothetical protein
MSPNSFPIDAGIGISMADLALRGRVGWIILAIGSIFAIGAMIHRHRVRRRTKTEQDDRLDTTIEDSFPASDPPSFAGQR